MDLQPPLEILPKPAYGDRLALLGNSGEGKTEVGKALVLAEQHVITVNTKDDPALDVLGQVVWDSDIFQVEGGRYVWHQSDDWKDWTKYAEQNWNRFFDWGLRAGGPRIINIDEWIDICPSAQRYPFQAMKAVKQGRFRRLSIWGGTQEIPGTPRWCFSQSQYAFIFYLGWPPHRKLAEDYVQTTIPWDQLPERSHKFIIKTPKGCFGPQPPIELVRKMSV